MATITTIQSTDLITDSRADINDNFANLNSDKIETSVLDTDTTLAANSDSKIPTQKAVKAYVDAGGNPNASTTQAGIVEEATQAELTAGTQTGGTGARLFLNPVHTVSTSAGAGDSGKIPRLNSSGVLDSTITGSSITKSYSVVENMDGTTTPVAVCVNADGKVQKAEADVSGLDKFIGFCTDNITTAESSFINGSSNTGSTTLSFTANAGTNRVAFIHVALTGAPYTAPSSVTYNGNNCTLIQNSNNGTTRLSATYYYVLGTNLSNDSAINIVVNGSSYTTISIQATCYGNVDQSTPVGIKAVSSGNSTTPNTTIDPTAVFSRIIQTTCGSGTSTLTANSGQTERVSTGLYANGFFDVQNKTGASTGYQITQSTSNVWASQAFEVVVSTSPTSLIKYSGVVTTSGLTPNAKYYLQNTAGTIGTSAGSTTVLLGKALSSTELIIIQN